MSRLTGTPHPAIPSVPDGVSRPFWSVMIPTFNCAQFLRTALESVLQQNYPPDSMQIEVVDDCSDRDDPERVVRKFGQDRVTFFRQARNLGHVGNFTTCLGCSSGEVIHILHGDDYVLPGFYAKMERALRNNPNVGAAVCRHIVVDESGRQTKISPLPREEAGIWANVARDLAHKQVVTFSSIIVRRSVYECLGGFDPRFSWTEDWEMWIRVAAHYPIWYEPEPLAAYRLREGSNTSRLILTGENIRDMRRCIDTFKDYFPLDERSAVVAIARQTCAQFAITTARELFIRGRQKGAFLQLQEAVKCSSRFRTIRSVLRTLIVGILRPWLVPRSQG